MLYCINGQHHAAAKKEYSVNMLVAQKDRVGHWVALGATKAWAGSMFLKLSTYFQVESIMDAKESEWSQQTSKNVSSLTMNDYSLMSSHDKLIILIR